MKVKTTASKTDVITKIKHQLEADPIGLSPDISLEKLAKGDDFFGTLLHCSLKDVTTGNRMGSQPGDWLIQNPVQTTKNGGFSCEPGRRVICKWDSLDYLEQQLEAVQKGQKVSIASTWERAWHYQQSDARELLTQLRLKAVKHLTKKGARLQMVVDHADSVSEFPALKACGNNLRLLIHLPMVINDDYLKNGYANSFPERLDILAEAKAQGLQASALITLNNDTDYESRDIRRTLALIEYHGPDRLICCGDNPIYRTNRKIASRSELSEEAIKDRGQLDVAKHYASILINPIPHPVFKEDWFKKQHSNAGRWVRSCSMRNRYMEDWGQ